MAQTPQTAARPTGFFARIGRIAVVRFLVVSVLLLAGYIGLQLLPLLVPSQVRHANLGLTRAVAALVLCAGMLGLYVGLVRLFEARAASELALRPGIRWAAMGVAVGAGLFGLTMLLLAVAGVVSWGAGNASGLAIAALLALVAGVGEELVFRGGVFRILEDALGSAPAMAISGALFGLVHSWNPGATLVSSAAIALEAGVLLAAVYAATRSLWAPIGLHFGWNFTEGGVFGAAVSGGGQAHGLINVTLNGPTLLTGGDFGPEASIVALAVSLVASALLIALAIRRGRWRSLRFRMMLEP